MKTAIQTDKAPKAVGPYSQAIRTGNMLFCSGQIPLNPATAKVEAEGIVAQTEQVLKNIQGLLSSERLTLGNVVKTTVFLKNMSDFSKFNEVYAGHFQAPFPSRSTVEVAALPLNVLVEIECIAIYPS